MADYVGLRGQNHIELAMELFKALTKRFSAESGSHYFLLESPEQTLAALNCWVTDGDGHARRLIQEGTRP